MADDPKKPLGSKRKRYIYSSSQAYWKVRDERDQIQSQLQPSAIEEPSADLENEQLKLKNKTALTILELLSHTLILGLTIGSIWLIHLILEELLGKEAKFFNYIPISWIIDAAHLTAIGKFIWEIISDFRDRKK